MTFFEPQMYARRLQVLSLAIGITAIAACSGDGNRSRGFSGTEPNSRQFNITESLTTVSFAGGDTLSLTENYGSGAFRPLNGSNDVFYTISDRGPTIDCADSQAAIGVANFCGGNSGSIFAIPAYVPKIIKWQLSGIGTALKLEQTEVITLKGGSNGVELNGLPNSFSNASNEKAFGPSGIELQPSPSGVDPEAIVQLDNGKFWIAEENGPSLLLVDVDGRVLQRQVPAGSAFDLGGANYTVSDAILPAIFSRRKIDRGIEALALSPDNKFLYFIMQSPLENPDSATAESSRNVRIGKIELNSDGTPNAMVGEYLYRLDPSSNYGIKSDNSGDLDGNGDFLAQSEVTINEAIALAEDYLVVVEQAKTVSKYFRINLVNATNILGTSADTFGISPSVEEQENPSGIKFVTKQLGFDSLTMPLPDNIEPLAENIEGMALLDSNFAVLLNDNQYGIYDDASIAKVLPIGSFVVQSSAPLEPSLDYANSASYMRGDSNFGSNAATSVVADSASEQMFVVNNQSNSVDVWDISEPLTPPANSTELNLVAAANDAGISIDAPKWVTIGGGYVAVAINNINPQANGILALYDLDDLSLVTTYTVGAAPKMIIFDALSTIIAVANEGVPSDDYSVDPVGSVTIIDISDGVDTPVLTTIGFEDFNVGGSKTLPAGVRIYGANNPSVAQDLEPEHIAVSLDNNKLFVTLQENNAVAVIDIAGLSIDRIIPLGRKDFGVAGNELDVNDDGNIDIRTWSGVYGMYQPDGIAAYRFGNKNYFVTANDGKVRANSAFNEAVRAQDADGFGNAAEIDAANPSAFAAQNSSQLGRLFISSEAGDTDNDGDIDEITAFGARSFSIWSEDGKLMYDSGADLAKITQNLPNNGFNDLDQGSDESGAKPKSISLLSSLNRIYAFVSLERTGGIAVYDITSPLGVQFIQYVNNRFDNSPGVTKDFGADGTAVFFLDSKAYLVIANAMSGNVRVIEVDPGVETSE
ncbi:choice-of-anchor I family protein [Zhongshania aquimaris]|uniref:Choice-of-anchor I family protein n=1 Tax=Zhongshania aquimaris TaxID=2857107 RepID=A0ABS6VPY2_9GAMM|nr:choice-of-anchor I family protein [Zhongshania aquimaris]MBW2940380.1 choice-of-anchor I family protein [Zhongshania aquimaris]